MVNKKFNYTEKSSKHKQPCSIFLSKNMLTSWNDNVALPAIKSFLQIIQKKKLLA